MDRGYGVMGNDSQCNRKFVGAGIGIGLAREYPWEDASDKLAYLDVAEFNEKQAICSYYKKQSAYGNVAHFLKFLKSKIE